MDAQEKLMQFQQLQQHIEQITEHSQRLQQQAAEIYNSKVAIKEFGGCGGAETLAPIANGIFVKAEIKDTSTFLVNVGADTVVEKSSEQIIALLEEQENLTNQKIAEAEDLLNQFHGQLEVIYQEIQG